MSPGSPFSTSSLPAVRFHNPAGQTKVRPELDVLLGKASKSLRAAVCYFTEPGQILLSSHKDRLSLPDSFFVAGIDPPTNLESVERLHQQARGHVYLHMGGTTPKEKIGKGYRALMHSKVFLSEGLQKFELWVGSHNLTGMAIEGGNFEAALTYSSVTASQVIQDAIQHLEACRNSAELFNPDDMVRYQAIQKERAENNDWDIERSILVIHAEAAHSPTGKSFIVRVQVRPTELDKLFRTDGQVRLFLHAPGSLTLKKPVDYHRAVMWSGEVTAVVRTEEHPKNRGARGQFAGANYDVDIPDLETVPKLITGGTSALRARTQVVIRAGNPGEVGAELFSIDDKSPLKNTLAGTQPLELHQIDHDMVKFFTPDSVVGSSLVYRPVIGIRQGLVVKGYEETVQSAMPEKLRSPFDADVDNLDAENRVEYQTVEPKHPIDPFFFVSKHVVRRKQ